MAAILSDYNLSDPSEVDAARQLLSALSSETTIDEAAGFDPSGASGPHDLESSRADDESTSPRSQQGWKSQTDDTSLSQEVSALGLEGLDISDNSAAKSREDSSEGLLDSEIDTLDEEGKEGALLDMFPTLKPFDIKWTLKKCKGHAASAIDELMTQSFLEDGGSRNRGIDAFSESQLPSRPRKSKNKKARVRRMEDDEDPSDSASPSQNKWDTATQDIEFIASKTGMPVQQVSSIYHKNGTSIRTTIEAIVDAYASMKLRSDDPMSKINVSELQQDFPFISTSDLEILVQITHPSMDDARELAKALGFQSGGSKSPIQLEFRHLPINLGSESTNAKVNVPNEVHKNVSIPAAELASTYFQARDIAFLKAHAAFRKGKSDPLMGGAAAYYSQVGRENDAKARSAASAAADALISMQRSRTELDLHGLNVKDAVRISREKVTSWWHELGERRAGTRGIGPGYLIITGKGNHSEGSGKLGPAVGKMLVREGWKVEVRSGSLVVMGVMKKT